MRTRKVYKGIYYYNINQERWLGFEERDVKQFIHVLYLRLSSLITYVGFKSKGLIYIKK